MKPGKTIIDHANLDIIDLIEEFGVVPGLTICKEGFTSQHIDESSGMLPARRTK
ncbi:hypothetical protein Q2T46_15635 [Thermoanaerobacterium sp. CMT5567-10]|nr:hypothetical protein [Thermoanaerobacterium sp. CMT5567-10]WLY85451.1 hypothetical protein Q2T46_15635 [Thermoanaerobacterium sp. CMT5567-10]